MRQFCISFYKNLRKNDENICFIISQVLIHSLSKLFYSNLKGEADKFECFQDFFFGKKF